MLKLKLCAWHDSPGGCKSGDSCGYAHGEHELGQPRRQEQGGSAEDVERQQKRTVRASREQSEEVKKLLGLMGVPVVDAPCEAEATCAALAKAEAEYAEVSALLAGPEGVPISLQFERSVRDGAEARTRTYDVALRRERFDGDQLAPRAFICARVGAGQSTPATPEVSSAANEPTVSIGGSEPSVKRQR